MNPKNITQADITALTEMNFYERLGVAVNATTEEINKAYRKMSLLYHPDKNSSPLAQEVFVLIGDAKDTLIDERQRSQYQNTYQMGCDPRKTWRGMTQNQIFEMGINDPLRFKKLFNCLAVIFDLKNRFPQTAHHLFIHVTNNPDLLKLVIRNHFDITALMRENPEAANPLRTLLLQDPVLFKEAFDSMDDLKKVAKYIDIPQQALEQTNLNAAFELLFNAEQQALYQRVYLLNWFDSLSTFALYNRIYLNKTPTERDDPQWLYVCMNEMNALHAGLRFFSAHTRKLGGLVLTHLPQRINDLVTSDYKEIGKMKEFKEGIFMTEEMALNLNANLL